MTDGNAVQPSESESAPSVSAPKEAFPTTAATPKTATPEAVKPVATTASSGNRGNDVGFLRRFFWLEERVNEAKKLSFGPHSPGFSEFDLAKQVHTGVVQIGESGESNAAVLLLERIEGLALLQCHLQKSGLPTSNRTYLVDEDYQQARSIPCILEVWNELSTAQQSAITIALGPDAERSILALDTKNRRYLASGLRKLNVALHEPLEFEANRVGRVLFVRWARIVAAALVSLGVVMAGLSAYAKATAKPNIALHRPVTISSQSPNEGLDHTLLVDGDTTNLGFHTNLGENQFCVIDLGADKPISKVVVYNRADCCQERAVPLRLEVSSDGNNYRTLSEKKDVFDSWTADKLNTKARYIKLRLGNSNFFHLSEVEVY